MAFDIEQIPVPFRMQPGLARLPAGAPQLTALRRDSPLFAEKHRVLQANASRHAVPGFDPGPAMRAIERQAREQGLQEALTGDTPLELAFEEDFAVLDAGTGIVPWLCVCVPSHWAPEDKVGASLAAIHAPVADNALLQAAAAQMAGLVTGGGRWERHVWTISPSPRYDQHPRRHAAPAWPDTSDPHAFAQGCWLRSERQTFFPVGEGLRQAVFTIAVHLQPLVAAVDTPARAGRLHASLASMSDAVAAYKGLSAARPHLLHWLASQCV